MLVFGSKLYSQTCSSSILRVTTRPSLRIRIFEQAKFARLEVDGLAAAAHRARNQIHFEIARCEFCRRGAEGRPAGKREQTRHQLFEGKGLDEVIVAAGRQSLDAIVDAGKVGEEQHRRRYAFRPCQRHDAETVEMGQHAVEDDDVEGPPDRHLDPVASILGDLGVVPARTQPVRKVAGGLFVVLDDQDSHSVGTALGRPGIG
jgi:hypothetical protein